MIFNSIDFSFFLPIVFILYWFLFNKKLNHQNLFLVISSYFFYGWWDWRFLFLIAFSTIVDYSLALFIFNEDSKRKRKVLLVTSLLINLGLLGTFKYYNFFLDNIESITYFIGIPFNTNSLNIILPVGISFYTFQTLSYTIDVYKRKLVPTRNFVAFSAFVCFFPQLVAGPIERASNFLPQFLTNRSFQYLEAVDGLKQILWGLFKKIVIADNCAKYANIIFDNSELYSGSTLFFGAFLFSFQIYGDFSGYSDIAIGVSRLFGFNLKKNFAFPYFSRDIAEFWRRWHISLSTWFRDYLYIPLGGSKGGLFLKIRNTFIIFIVSGFWHGANWTFVFWGILNAIYFLPLLLTNNNRNHIEIIAIGKTLPSLKDLFSLIVTFTLVLLAWVLFRANNLEHALSIYYEIFSSSFFSLPSIHSFLTLSLIIIFITIEWFGREYNFAIEKIFINNHLIIRWSFYLLICLSIILIQGEKQDFIYFQF